MSVTTSPLKNAPQKRFLYFDLIRCLACIAVIFIHSTGGFVERSDVFSNDFVFATAVNSLSRMAVPLFVMISGALMLDENYNFSTKKQLSHIKKMLIFFAFWSACYSLFFNLFMPLLKHSEISIKTIAISFLKGHYHLWYCFMIIGLYLFLPLFRLWVKRENKKYIEYFLILALLCNFFFRQIAEVGMKFSDWFFPIEYIFLKRGYLEYVGGFSFYYVLGWYLHNFPIKKKNLIYALGAVGYLWSFGGTVLCSRALGETCLTLDSFTVNVAAQAACIFVLMQSLCERRPRLQDSPVTRLASVIAKYSLGIYAVHDVIKTTCFFAFEKLHIDSLLLIVPGTILITLVLSLLVSFILSRLPLLKRVV